MDDTKIVEAGLVLLEAQRERAKSGLSAVDAALGRIGKAPDDAISRGPKSSLTDAQIDGAITTIQHALTTQRNLQSAAKMVMGLFF